ncbi:beta-1,4-galactosyltransferase 7-like [Pecten maximus]|uniref:beta-1,4-galactosyltransferase 7-like n=1 Tax=Pecten maximus TaxID=6579 RepID=UPI0014583F4A|nr:beta-1,4-galactosyltransferase 7-like [Pecten maximus]
MALIIPYRNCSEELQQFAPHMLNYLSQKVIPHRMYVIHQVDDFRFNRGALINVGFQEMDSDCDYVAMHDVDHLAIDPQLDYGYPSERPRHLAKSKYARAVGGVLLMTNEHYRKVNGLSNYFWGWGREDDNLFRRIQHARLKVQQPAYTFSSSAYRLIHNEDKRPRDKETHYNQEKMTHRFDIKSGLNSSRYTIESRNITIVNGAAVRFINVHLYCNLTETPSCSKLTS